MQSPHILVFDSGAGGLSVAAEIHKLHPDCRLSYVADHAFFPYGLVNNDETLIHRCRSVIEYCIRTETPDIVIIACNTASTLALPILRTHFPTPFIGVVPAIKPAAAISKTGAIGILATPATTIRSYTTDLINEFAQDKFVYLHGSDKLVRIAEAYILGSEPSKDELHEEMTSLLVQSRDKNIDSIVLACTHFPLIKEQLMQTECANSVKHWVDSGEAIARRVSYWRKQLGLFNTPSCEGAAGDASINFIFTTDNTQPANTELAKKYYQGMVRFVGTIAPEKTQLTLGQIKAIATLN